MTTTQNIHHLVNPARGRKFMFILDQPEQVDGPVSVVLENTGTVPEHLVMRFAISETFEALIKADEGLATNFLRPSTPTATAAVTFHSGVCYNMSRKTARYLWEVLTIAGFTKA